VAGRWRINILDNINRATWILYASLWMLVKMVRKFKQSGIGIIMNLKILNIVSGLLFIIFILLAFKYGPQFYYELIWEPMVIKTIDKKMENCTCE